MKCINLSEDKNYMELEWEGRVLELRKAKNKAKPIITVLGNLHAGLSFPSGRVPRSVYAAALRIWFAIRKNKK